MRTASFVFEVLLTPSEQITAGHSSAANLADMFSVRESDPNASKNLYALHEWKTPETEQSAEWHIWVERTHRTLSDLPCDIAT